MSDTSRRKFLAVAGAGTAAGAVGLAASGPAQAATTQRHQNASREPVVAYVSDARSDVVHLMVGDREVVVEDRELAARILNAAGRGKGGQ